MSAGQEVFGHIKKAHTDLSVPALLHEETSRVGWGLSESVSKNGASVNAQEMLETLTILSPEERYLLAVDNALAYAYGDLIAVDYNSRFSRSSIAVKGQGRKDAKEVMGSVKQSISIPTTLQKVRRILTGGGKKEDTPEQVEDGAIYEG